MAPGPVAFCAAQVISAGDQTHDGKARKKDKPGQDIGAPQGQPRQRSNRPCDQRAAPAAQDPGKKQRPRPAIQRRIRAGQDIGIALAKKDHDPKDKAHQHIAPQDRQARQGAKGQDQCREGAKQKVRELKGDGQDHWTLILPVPNSE